MFKPFLTLVAVLAAATPVFATNEFYIVRGPDRHCTVMRNRPNTAALNVVGDTAYKTMAEAEAAIHRICTMDAGEGDNYNE
jgi:hypothetical protein